MLKILKVLVKQNIHKSFSGVKALDNGQFEPRAGKCTPWFAKTAPEITLMVRVIL